MSVLYSVWVEGDPVLGIYRNESFPNPYTGLSNSNKVCFQVAILSANAIGDELAKDISRCSLKTAGRLSNSLRELMLMFDGGELEACWQTFFILRNA